MASSKEIVRYRLTDHAREEMVRRRIGEEDVARVVSGPEQRYTVRDGRDVLQSRVTSGDPPKTHLLRVFVDIDRDPPDVVTVYRTSRVAQYWRADS